MARITPAMLDEMRRLEAEGCTQKKIATIVGCSMCSVGDFLTGKRTPLEAKAKVKASAEQTKLGTCPDCKGEATQRYPLQRCADRVFRCPKCGGEDRLRRKGRMRGKRRLT